MTVRKRTKDLALGYLDRHLYSRFLFPIKAGKKFPPLIRDNLEKASNDPAQIIAWEEKWPGCNWGVAHRKSNLLVADVDTNEAKGKRGQETYDFLDLMYGWPDTEVTTTPSGGHHHIYSGPHIMALGENGIGLDIDSPNYTLIPGCTFDDGTSYVGNDVDAVPCPQWIYDTIKNSKAKARIADAGDVVVELDKPENIELAIDFLKSDAEPAIEGQGGDFNTLKTAMYLKDLGISPQLAPDLLNEYYNPRCEPPWDMDDLIKKVTNAYNYSTLSKVGGKTAEADFADDPPEPTPPMSPRAKKEKKEREKARARETSKPDDPSRAKTKDQVLNQWVWIVGMKRFINRVDPKGNYERDMWDTRQFDSEFNNVFFPNPKKGSASDFLFREKKGGIARYYRVGFKPGEPQSMDSGQTFNFYRDPDVVPAEGDLSWWNAHLEYLFPNQEYRDHLLNWMAWLLQNLAAKPKHALIIQGEVNGTGKSFIGKVLTSILHQGNVSVVPQNGLSGRFNSWALQCKLIVVEELRAADRAMVKEALHDIITEDVIAIERKGVDAMKVENCFGIMAFTNDDAALTLDNTDRRYLIVRTDATPRPADYYAELFAKLRDPAALAAVAYSLVNRDLQGYSGQQAAPMTAAKQDMKEAGATDLEHFLNENSDTYPLSGRVVCVDDVIAMLPRRLESKGTRLTSSIKAFLKRNGAVELGQCSTPSGKRPRLYALGPQAEFISLQARTFAGKLYEDDRVRAGKNQPLEDLEASEEFSGEE